MTRSRDKIKPEPPRNKWISGWCHKGLGCFKCKKNWSNCYECKGNTIPRISIRRWARRLGRYKRVNKVTEEA